MMYRAQLSGLTLMRRMRLLPHAAIFAAALASVGIAGAAQAAGVRPEVIANNLEHPWALAFIGDKQMLVTERPGRMRIVQPDGKVGPAIEGLPKIDVGGQGGLHDVITDSEFARNRMLYFCYAEPATDTRYVNSTAMASARLSDDGKRLEKLNVIFSQRPKVSSSAHFGCRVVEHTDGTLFLTLGDRYKRMDDAQTLDNHLGKVVRVRKDGSVPPDNPYAGDKGAARNALPEIWSAGHRNSQGAALGPDNQLWTHELGPQGGDEINRPEAGKNYGWPVITYGEKYGGGKIGKGLTNKPGMEKPLYYWVPSISPSGMAFLKSHRYGKTWQGDLFVGSLSARHLQRLSIRDGNVAGWERLLQDLDSRIRDVREGPDGLLYVLTDESNGKLIRLLPSP
jgi:glucose/arabinose dehydrogenase